MNNTLVILPTYNEKENIENLIDAIKSITPQFEILVIDDNSPDGTAKIVARLTKTIPGLHLMKRGKMGGLGTAYIDGFKFALKREIEHVITMDADFSHDPKYLQNLSKKDKKFDIVIASRYKNKKSTVSWSVLRFMLSTIGNTYIRLLTGLPIKDCTSGFKRYSVSALKCLDLEKFEATHFAFQVEIIFKLFKKGFTFVEIPFVFKGRTKGKSKISKEILLESIWIPWKLAFLNFSTKSKSNTKTST